MLRRAFSLVELLVVVSIISMLLLLLSPVLGRARKLVRSVNCRSNLHQIQLAMTGYVQAYKGDIFRYYLTFDTFWVNHLRKFNGNIDDIRLCPSAAKEGYGVGSFCTAWTGRYSPGSWMNNGQRFIYGSYGFNAWLHPNPGRGPQEYYFGTLDKVRVPDTVPAFLDANWVDGWLDHTDPPPPDRRGSTTVPNLARFAIKRHGQSINGSFMDGSARNIPLDDLFQYQWSVGFQVGSPLVLPPDEDDSSG